MEPLKSTGKMAKLLLFCKLTNESTALQHFKKRGRDRFLTCGKLS